MRCCTILRLLVFTMPGSRGSGHAERAAAFARTEKTSLARRAAGFLRKLHSRRGGARNRARRPERRGGVEGFGGRQPARGRRVCSPASYKRQRLARRVF